MLMQSAHVIGKTGLNYNFRLQKRRMIGGALSLRGLISGIGKIASAVGKKGYQALTSETSKKLARDVAKKGLDKLQEEGVPALSKAASKKAMSLIGKVEQKIPSTFQEQVRPVISQIQSQVEPEMVQQEVNKVIRKYRQQKGLGKKGGATYAPNKIVNFL
jgi:hypothetical protein